MKEKGKAKDEGTKKNMTGKRRHILCLKIHVSPEKSKPLFCFVQSLNRVEWIGLLCVH